MKRPEHIIEDLITRQLDGTPLTDTERRELQEWLEASEANRDAFLRAYKAWGNARLAETRFNTGQALENVMARIAEASRPRSFLRPQLRRLGIGIAAAACVMLAVVGYYRLQPSTVPDIEMFIRQADTPESYISWIHGYLPFDNDPLSNILERLSRYYNCRIECTPEAEALTLSGKLELKDDPAEVLKILSATAPINLQITESGNFRIDYNPTTNNPN